MSELGATSGLRLELGDGRGGRGARACGFSATSPDTSIACFQAALLVDDTGRVLYGTERPGPNALQVSRVVGHDWRELFAEFEEVEIEAEPAPDTSFFLSTETDRRAFRVRRCGASPIPGTGGGHFIIVDAIGDPAAVDELIYQERMVALGQIAAGVAHEVNNPLTTISGWLQILLSEVDENDKRRAPLQLMNDEVGRVANIIHHLLTFGRRTPSEPQLIRVNHLLADVLALVEYQMRNENIYVVTNFCSNLPLIKGDPNQLKQVFLNVIVNARQAMPSGGTLEITTAVAEDGSVEIALADTGCGMAPEVVQKIFEPFYTTKGKGGSGIGLFLCQNIVKDHRGSLTVSSRPGEGSTFIIKLPAAPVQETVRPVALAALPGSAGGMKQTREPGGATSVGRE